MRFDLTQLDGVSLTAIFLIIFFTTFLTEEGACLAAGALAGQGRITFSFALTACFAGILVGDVWLYAMGRAFGNSITKSKVFRRFVSEESLVTASEWLEKRGVAAIFISRFVAGLRLPTYVAAGFLKTNFLKFLFFFVIAAGIWTPIIVGSAAYAQKFISPRYIFGSMILFYVLLHLAFNLTTWTRRRLFIGKIRRITNWEFWPPSIFYFPVVLYVFFLAIRHPSLTVFTAANPAIEAGGFIAESKDVIYSGLGKNTANEGFLLRHLFIPADWSYQEKTAALESWMLEFALDYPIVFKPNVGERGKDVAIVRNRVSANEILDAFESDILFQEFIAGPEISVFYYRYPSQENGKIFSITDKIFPVVKGDGESSLEELILNDKRAVCLAGKYFEQNHERLNDVPPVGESVQIIEIGTHSRGAIFADGSRFNTTELETSIDSIVKNYKGFYFGRLDLRAAAETDFAKGRGFKIIDLNGVAAHSTNIYDKKFTLFGAYRILFRQWKIAFTIGAENFARGYKPTRLRDLIRLLFRFETNKAE